LVLGRDLADALLFTGQRVVPTRLLESGFVFAHAELDVALRHVLGR
jgi:NAD dependent epimerase/dehydratase family enzyme